MRVGVVGAGYWGSKHIRVLHGLAEVERVVIVDQCESRWVELESAFPGSLGFAELDLALDHVDAVVIATPPSTHGELGLQALRAGKHVLIEKPLATSSFEVLQLMQQAKESGLVLMAGHTFEYNAAVTALRDLVHSGGLGDVLYIDAARLNLGLYQQDCNVVWDLAPHDVSIVNYVLGETPSAVHAWGATHIHDGLIDVAYLRLEYESVGVTAQVHVSWLDPQKVRRLTIVGSQKMAVYNDLADDQRLRIYDKGVESANIESANRNAAHETPMSYRYGGIVAPYIPFQEPLSVEDRHFIESAAQGSAPRTGGANGLAVVQVLEAAQISLAEGRTVRLDELTVRLDEKVVRLDEFMAPVQAAGGAPGGPLR